MGLLEDIRREVAMIFAANWQRRAGKVVPEAEDVRLGNDAVTLDATVLYADLVKSTALVDDYKDYFAAEIYKSYLVSACKIIRSENGELVAFDGDRVMAVYLGGQKNSAAARTALKINWTVKDVVNPAIKKQYPNTSYSVAHAIGIDTGKLFVVRTGIRGSNDLVWVGRAANHAAKLCELREAGYPSYITEGVYRKLNDASKYGGSPRQDMWEKRTWSGMGRTVYRSSYWWKL